MIKTLKDINMEKTKVEIHVLLRVAGSVSLTLGVFFSVFGASNRTVSTIFLWIALSIGILSLIFAYLWGRSWYSGIVIFGATYFFIMTRTSANNILSAIAFILTLSVALFGVFLNPYAKSFKRRIFK
jgi:hypothetical protein